MTNAASRALFMAAGLLLVACSRPGSEESTTPAPAATASTTFEIMNASVIPRSNLIWELAGNLYDDDGNIDAGRLTAAQWQELQDAAAAMGASAKMLAEAKDLKVAAADVKIQGEGTEGAATAAEVQAAMDADPNGFSEHAMQLVSMADEIAAAATAHDGRKADDASGRLTDVCGACHAKFWYPKEAAQ